MVFLMDFFLLLFQHTLTCMFFHPLAGVFDWIHISNARRRRNPNATTPKEKFWLQTKHVWSLQTFSLSWSQVQSAGGLFQRPDCQRRWIKYLQLLMSPREAGAQSFIKWSWLCVKSTPGSFTTSRHSAALRQTEPPPPKTLFFVIFKNNSRGKKVCASQKKEGDATQTRAVACFFL